MGKGGVEKGFPRHPSTVKQGWSVIQSKETAAKKTRRKRIEENGNLMILVGGQLGGGDSWGCLGEVGGGRRLRRDFPDIHHAISKSSRWRRPRPMGITRVDSRSFSD